MPDDGTMVSEKVPLVVVAVISEMVIVPLPRLG